MPLNTDLKAPRYLFVVGADANAELDILARSFSSALSVFITWSTDQSAVFLVSGSILESTLWTSSDASRDVSWASLEDTACWSTHGTLDVLDGDINFIRHAAASGVRVFVVCGAW